MRGRRVASALATLIVLVALAARAAHAQDFGAAAGPRVPLGSRLDQLAAWLVAEGQLRALDPLTRPWTTGQLQDAVATQDTAVLGAHSLAVLGWLREELTGAGDPHIVSAELREDAYHNGRRDNLRPGGGSGQGLAGGLYVAIQHGPLMLAVSPAFENRLRDDPEFTGYKHRFIDGRLQSGYVAWDGRNVSVSFGRFARDWGPSLFGGLQLSPSAYATDVADLTLRAGRFSLTTLAQRLDDDTVSIPGTHVDRYFLAHRLGIAAGRGVHLAITETGVYGGPGRGLEPAFMVPVAPAVLAEYDQHLEVNLIWGVEAYVPLSRSLTIEGQGVIDDIQVDRNTLNDRRPASGGYTLVARLNPGALPVHVALGYTRVLALTYRNSVAPWYTYDAAGVGIARNFADYDQLLLRLETRPARSLSLLVEGSLMRQGAGDFRQPFPSDTVLAQPGQGFLVAPVTRLNALRAALDWHGMHGLEIRGQLGTVQTKGGGTSGIASISVGLTADLVHRRLHGLMPGVEPY